MRFFDYLTNSAHEELSLAFQRTSSESEGWDQVGSLEGRAVCLLRVGVHCVSIALKPLNYLISALVGHLALCCLSCGVPEDSQEGREVVVDAGAFRDNPEYQGRMFDDMNGMLLAAPAAVLSQIIQVCKAVFGIFHPGIYFTNDELAPYFQQLTLIAKEVGCSFDLIEKLERGSEIIHDSLFSFPHAQFYYAEYKRDLAVISLRLQDTELPATRKLCILSMLHPDSEESAVKSGIEGCPGAVGRILQQMRANLEVPEAPGQVLPWLIAQFKGEIINTMIIQSEATKGMSDRPSWHDHIRKLALDPAHRGNALILAIGPYVALSSEMMLRAAKDPMVVRTTPMEGSDAAELVEAFNNLCTDEALLTALLEKINSQSDGSTGLKTFRNQVIEALAAQFTEEELSLAGDPDPAMYAVQLYYLNGGVGDVSEPGFNNLNATAIMRYAQAL